MENFIQRNIVSPLTYALQSGTIAKERVIGAMKCCIHSENWDAMNVLSDAMLPFYKKYFFADPSILGYAKWEVREVIRYCMGRDSGFFSWVAEERNLLDTAYSWAEYHKKRCQSHNADTFLKLLECMADMFYVYDCVVESDTIRKVLVKERIEGNAYSREIFCIMHAFITIWHEEHSTLEQKIRLFKLLSRHWTYIRAIYSAMLQRVVGYGFTEIAAIAHSVKKDIRHRPYIHLFYSAVMEHKEKIIHSGTKRDKLGNALVALREIVASTEPSDELDELCRILFSDKLKEYLERHRLKNYRELEEELQRITAQTRILAEQLSSMISVDVIAQKLLDLPPQTARAVFLELNAMLMGNEAWVKIQVNLYNRILARTIAPEVKIDHADQVIAVAENNANVIHTKIEEK